MVKFTVKLSVLILNSNTKMKYKICRFHKCLTIQMQAVWLILHLLTQFSLASLMNIMALSKWEVKELNMKWWMIILKKHYQYLRKLEEKTSSFKTRVNCMISSLKLGKWLTVSRSQYHTRCSCNLAALNEKYSVNQK